MTFRILSLDGGGIRGIVAARILEYVEKKLDISICEHFDLIAGTSTGAIVAAGLAVGKTPSQLVDLYMNEGSTIFPRASGFCPTLPLLFRPKFSPNGLEQVLRTQFQDRTLGSLELPLIITTYDTIRRKAIFFKGHKDQKWYNQIPIWQVCMCSAAAPTYFPAYDLDLGVIRGMVPKAHPEADRIYLNCPTLTADDDLTNMTIKIVGGQGIGQQRKIKRYLGDTQEAIVSRDEKQSTGTPDAWTVLPDSTSEYEITHYYTMVDGGVGANNPEGCAIAEGIRLNIEQSQTSPTIAPMSLSEAIRDLSILSIGTGNLLQSIAVGEWGFWQWGPHIVDIVMNAPSDIYYYISKQILTGESGGDRRNLRLQPRLREDLSSIDNTSQQNLDALLQETDAYMNSPNIDQRLANFLAL